MKKVSVFLLLVLISLPFRLYHLNYPLLDAFNFRQTQTATFALNFYKNGINLLQTEIDIAGIGKEKYLTLEFPLYEAIVTLLYKSFFFDESWGRIVTIISGYIAAFYIYKLVNLLTLNKKLAFFSSFFFLFAPLNMFYQRAFMIDPTVIAFLLAGSYYFCHWVLHQDNKSYLLSILLLTLGFIQKGLYGPFWLIPLSFYYLRKNKLRAVLNPMFILLLLIPLFSLFIWQRHVDFINTRSGQEYFTSYNRGHLEWNFGLLSDRLSLTAWEYRGRQILNGLFLKPGLVLFLIGIVSATKFERTGFFYAWVFSQLVYFLLVFRIQSQNYYQLSLVPVATIFISIGLLRLSNVVEFKLSKIAAQLFILFFCLIYIMRSWQNSLPSFFIDWDWYRRIVKIGEVVGERQYGIFATAGNDWNSSYTYYSGKKMKQVGVENLSLENIKVWKEEGYSFLVLHEFEKYPQYLRESKPETSLEFLKNFKEVETFGEFKVYLLN